MLVGLLIVAVIVLALLLWAPKTTEKMVQRFKLIMSNPGPKESETPEQLADRIETQHQIDQETERAVNRELMKIAHK